MIKDNSHIRVLLRACVISNVCGASLKLDQDSDVPLKRPVVFVKGGDALKLMNIVNKQKVARARIQHGPPRVSDDESDTEKRAG